MKPAHTLILATFMLAGTLPAHAGDPIPGVDYPVNAEKGQALHGSAGRAVDPREAARRTPGSNTPRIFDRWGNSPKKMDGGGNFKVTENESPKPVNRSPGTPISGTDVGIEHDLGRIPGKGGTTTLRSSKQGDPIPGTDVGLEHDPDSRIAAPGKGGTTTLRSRKQGDPIPGVGVPLDGDAYRRSAKPTSGPVGPAGAPVSTSRSNKKSR